MIEYSGRQGGQPMNTTIITRKIHHADDVLSKLRRAKELSKAKQDRLKRERIKAILAKR